MKKSWRKVLSLLLTGVLLLGTTACNNTKQGTESKISSESQVSTADNLKGNESIMSESSDSVISDVNTEITASTAPKSSSSVTPKPNTSNAVGTAEPQEDCEVAVTATKQDIDIIREDSDAKRRLVYLKLTNQDKITRKDMVLTYTEDGKSYKRELSTLYLNEKIVYDTVWLKSDTKSVPATLRDASGKELWKGVITVQKAGKEQAIKKSTIYNNATLKPGTVRGVNYYPRQTPWSQWTNQNPSTWDSEMKEISQKLNVNAIRTFAECWETDQLLGKCVSPNYIATLDKLFAAADKYGIHVLFCLMSAQPFEQMSYNFRYVRSIVEPFINDGRVLAWDLINEVDDKGLSDPNRQYVTDFCVTMYPKLSEFDPNHTNQIGFAFMLDKAVSAGLTFTGKNQSWQYHYYRKTSAENIAIWIKNYFHDTPFFLGECGDTSAEKVADGAPREDLGEDWQLEVYKTLIPAFNETVASGHKMIGMFAWICYDFPTMANQSTGQGDFGLIRADGSLKPAGEYLAREYLKIKQSRPAQWDK